MPDQIEVRRPVPSAPVHPLAALATIVLDNVFGVVELIDPFTILLTSLAVGTVGFFSTMFVQRYLAKDEWGPSVAKGLVMGIIAGVPFQVSGTAVGTALLGWAGLHEWIRLPSRKPQGQLPGEDEIVDADVKDVE